MKKTLIIILSLVALILVSSCSAGNEYTDNVTIPANFRGTWAGAPGRYERNYTVEVTAHSARIRYKDYQWEYDIEDKPLKILKTTHDFSGQYENFYVNVRYKDGSEGSLSLKYGRDDKVLFYKTTGSFYKQ